MKKIISLFSFQFCVMHVMAQRQITGIVFAGNEHAFPATVCLQNDRNNTATVGLDGTFAPPVGDANANDTLAISYVGFKTLRKAVSDVHAPLNIVLKE